MDVNDTHYLYSLLIMNSELDDTNYQMNFFSDDEDNARRLNDTRSMLQDKFDKIKQVVIMSLEEYNGEILAVKALLCNSQGKIIKEQDLSQLASYDYNYDDSLEQQVKPKLLVDIKQAIRVKSIVETKKGRQELDDQG